ncbi:Gfo/Idh/MocA family oxidoreductase [Candidatus Dependentiae bacterium]|nr:Gfo/Idh/MocA family oxidoreductase [Candidatus Dependentiae bacterium]
MKDNVALIGYGYWGKKYYNYLKKSEYFNLCFVFAPSFEKIRSLENPEKKFISDIETILNNEDIPNVIIATPINTHYEIALKMLEHSKNILIEKPITMRLKEALELNRISSEKNKIIETDYTYTYSAALDYVKKLIEKKHIGNIQSIEISLNQLGRFLPYNIYYLLGSHALSILDLFLPIDECVFSPIPLMKNNDIVTSSVVTFYSSKHNCSGVMNLNLHSPIREKKIIIYGEKGTIYYTPLEKKVITITEYYRTEALTETELIKATKFYEFDENNNLNLALKNFHSVLHGKNSSNIKRSLSITGVLEKLCYE